MTATLSEIELPPLALAATDRPERPAVAVPVDDHGFMAMLREAEPDLAHAQQNHRGDGEVIHVWRHVSTHEYVVLIVRENGRHGVTESGAPLYDRLSQLAGMWLASDGPRPGDAR